MVGGKVQMKVWLDDRRPAPEGCVHVHTPEEAIELLRSGGVDELSLTTTSDSTSARASGPATTCSSGLEREVAAGPGDPAGRSSETG